MILIQAVFQFAGFGSEKGWIEIVAFAAAWAVVYSLALHTYEALKT